jgi:hypothetical protein
VTASLPFAPPFRRPAEEVAGFPKRPLATMAFMSLGLLAAVAMAASTLAAAQAQTAPVLIPLQCRLGTGLWQDCRMQVEEMGGHWWLLIGSQRVEFRHDGRGSVTMQQDNSGWRAVSSRWQEDTSLCWDGVCAKGEIPLD